MNGFGVRSVIEAKKDLVAKNGSLGDGNNRLEKDPECAIAHGRFDAGCPTGIGHKAFESPAGLLVEFDAIAPAGFCGIAGGIRHPKNVRRLACAINRRDANGGPDTERPSALGEDEGLDFGPQILANAQSIRHGAIGQDDDKFVPAETHQPIIAPHGTPKDVGNREEQSVAGVVAQRVVDNLEIVEIDVEQRAGTSGPRGEDGLADSEGQSAAVVEFGQRIVVGQVLEILLKLAAFGNVLDGRLGHGQAHIQESGVVGFADVVVGSGLKDFAEVVRAVVARAHENVVVAPEGMASQHPAELQSAHAGELDVEHDQREKRLAQHLSRQFGGLTPMDGMAPPSNHAFQEKPGRAVILDDQHIKGNSARRGRGGQGKWDGRGLGVHLRGIMPAITQNARRKLRKFRFAIENSHLFLPTFGLGSFRVRGRKRLLPMKIRAILLTVLLFVQPSTAKEEIDRGTVAIPQGKGRVFVSWRLLASDPPNAGFHVYRQAGCEVPKKLTAEPLRSATCFEDENVDLSRDHSYFVRRVTGGREDAADPAFVVRAGSKPYLEIPLQIPDSVPMPDGTSCTYTAGDCSVGDLYGDGQLEMVVKWDPSNARDNSQAGRTGCVYLDAYKFDGTRLWRINLGPNIRAGAHYSPFLVYDLDGDGRAEMACKTADGTVDGTGNPIGDKAADWRNPAGYILSGPEFLTVFDGKSGAALSTVPYLPPRHPGTSHPTEKQLKEIWGDGYGNRCDRFLGAVAYLDGNHPSLVMCRGYYTRTVLAAWDFRDRKLALRWIFDSDATSSDRKFRGQGHHSLSVADVDADGRDEIIYGSLVMDDNGRPLYSADFGHGDALHVSDLDPTHPGLEIFGIQERFDDAGMNFRNARTGEVYWKIPSVKAATSGGDKGEGPARGLAIDIDPRYPGAESWAFGAGMTGLYNAQGERIGERWPSSCNFGIWWDGDLQRELLDRNRIKKWNWADASETILLLDKESSSINGTKATPCLSGDLFGDWREEVVWRTNDSRALRIFTTGIPTTHRFVTLLLDRQYRLALAWQNGGYNQPPHPSFDLESLAKKPPEH